MISKLQRMAVYLFYPVYHTVHSYLAKVPFTRGRQPIAKAYVENLSKKIWYIDREYASRCPTELGIEPMVYGFRIRGPEIRSDQGI